MPGVGVNDEPEGHISGGRSSQDGNSVQEEKEGTGEEEVLCDEQGAVDEVEFDLTMSTLVPTRNLKKTVMYESKEVGAE